MAKLWYIVLAIVVVVGGIIFFASESTPNGIDMPETATESQDEISGGIEVPEGISVEPVAVHTVRVAATGFEPAMLTVKKGDSVTWVNESGRDVWPASAMHPTHTAYPTTGGCIGSTFDACSGIPTGNSWSFVFDEVGTWKYHDHLRASMTGSVIVE